MWTLNRYESLIYGIQATSSSIVSSNLVLQRRGKFYCWLVGEVQFAEGIRLEVTEALDFTTESFIRHYSYPVFGVTKNFIGTIRRLIPTIPPCKRLILITSTFRLISSIIVFPLPLYRSLNPICLFLFRRLRRNFIGPQRPDAPNIKRISY